MAVECAALQIIEDLGALCDAAHDEEVQGQHITTDCKVVAGGCNVYAHRALLMARSKFFRKALTHDMSETQKNVIELKHVSNEVSKETLHALLRFIYTGDTPCLAPSVAWGILELLGAEQADYFELSDCATLRSACQQAILENLELEDISEALQHAHRLGECATTLRQLITENIVYRLSDFSRKESLEQLKMTPELLLEIMAMVSACTVLKPGWQPSYHIGRVEPPVGRWTLSVSSSSPGFSLANSYEALNDPNMLTGAGTGHSPGRSEFMQATFEHRVRVRAVHLGLGHMSQGWGLANLHGAVIEYADGPDLAALRWNPAAQVCIAALNSINVHTFPAPIVAQYWRIRMNVTNQSMGMSYLKFE